MVQKKNRQEREKEGGNEGRKETEMEEINKIK